MADALRIGSHYIILDNVAFIDTSPDRLPDHLQRSDEEYDHVARVVYTAPAVPPVDGVTARDEWYTGDEAKMLKDKASSLR